MNRDAAIGLLARRDLARLSTEQRASLLLDWWFSDADGPGYAGLPDPLKSMLAYSVEPDDPTRALYDPLVPLALDYSYMGVVNTYLSMQLALPDGNVTVEGDVDVDVDEMVVCLCCRYLSVQTSANDEIGRVCFWEDDGMTELSSHSGLNHQTLRQAQENFQRIGAVTGASRRYVLPDGKQRYGLAIPSAGQ
ncbi:CPCC family cysteine-rich protein [Massilia sp. CCM 8734]|uniref:CPCC family cysteine-rich protein n=1 Tax=Massilia sp. CCM 8734 TaxID=2609283 RepID=UPI0014245EA3|nr:CPCC family cysteine-rich protein [Massilia sp. CCM 8734]